ncbi:MAG: hypothetical protein AAFZ38_01335 [Myxococcota bacterium]
MSSVGRSWGEWASDVASRAGELVESAAATTEEALQDAYEGSAVEVAVDYWATHSPEQVTREFRKSTDEFVSERLGETAGKAARLATVPLGAAARFSVQGVQGFDAVASKATDIATGRAALPTPGEVIAGTAVGIATYAKQTADAAGNAMVDGAIAVVQGDVEGVAAATENAAKAALDVGALVAGGRGVVSAKSILGGGGVMRAAGVGTTFTVGTQGALAAAGQFGVSVGALGVMSQAPMEARGRGSRSGGKSSPKRKPDPEQSAKSHAEAAGNGHLRRSADSEPAAVATELKLKKAVNSNLPHAIERGVERSIFRSAEEAGVYLRELTDTITQTGRFPAGTIADTSRAGRYLVPVGDGGRAVYQLGANGTARLKTVLIGR